MPVTLNYSTLVAAKGTAGAIANWVGYNKIDVETVLQEAQTVLFQSLRVREMRTQYVFGLAIGQSNVALPPRFLDPIGEISDNRGLRYRNAGGETAVVRRRYFTAVSGGTLGTNPFTSGAQYSSNLNVYIANHGLTQGSDITFPSGVPAVDGINIAGLTFPVIAIVDANNITITSPSGDQAVSGGVNGGGSGVTWTANMLNKATPSTWAIFDEAIQFDNASDTAIQCRMLYFRNPPLLSTTNQTNFITNRYPRLLREATNAAAASFMKDDDEEQKALTKLAALIEATNIESDLIYRGSDIRAETPGSNGNTWGGHW